jgi:transposase
MPSPYSYELRIGGVAAGEQGLGVTEANRPCGLHPDTVTAWRARKEATGEGQARGGSQRGPSPKSTDVERVKAFVQSPGAATVEERAEAWGGVKRLPLWGPLRKLGYTQKKSPFVMPSGPNSCGHSSYGAGRDLRRKARVA